MAVRCKQTIMLIDPMKLETELVRILQVAQRHAEADRQAKREWTSEYGCICWECVIIRAIHGHMEDRRRMNATAHG